MTVVFAEKFEDIARIVAAFPSGLPLDGKKYNLSIVSDVLSKAFSYYSQFGYIKLACNAIDTKSDTVFTWGEHIISREKAEGDDGKIYYTVKDSGSHQFENLKGILTGQIDTLIFVKTGEEDCYFKDIVDRFKLKKPAIKLCVLKEFTEDGIRTAFGRTTLLSPAQTSMALDYAQCYRDLIENCDERIENALSEVVDTGLYPGIESLKALNHIYNTSNAILRQELLSSYKISTTASFKGTKFTLSSPSLSFRSKETAEQVMSSLPKNASVTGVASSVEEELPKGAFTTARLIQTAKTQLGFSLKRTEDALSYLYKNGFISDPDTKTSLLPKDGKQLIYERLLFFAGTKTFKTMIEGMSFDAADDDFFSSTEDNGIVITDKVPKGLSDPDGQAIYQLIVTELIKVYYPVRKVKVVTIEAKNDQTKFKGTGRTLLDKGFSSLENRRPIKENVPFDIKKGDTLDLEYHISFSGQSSKSFPTFSDLLKSLSGDYDKDTLKDALSILESKGIISASKERYSSVKAATPLIRSLQSCGGLLDGRFLSSIKSNLESLRSETPEERAKTREYIFSELTPLLDYWEDEIVSCRPVRTGISCPVCGKGLYEISGSLFCYDCGYDAFLEYDGRAMSYDEMSFLFKEGATPLIPGFAGDYWKRLYLTPNKDVQTTNDSDFSCPVCKKKLWLRANDKSYVCSSGDCSFEFPRVFMDHEFTKKEKSALLTDYQLSGVNVKRGGRIEAVDLFLNIAKDGNIEILEQHS